MTKPILHWDIEIIDLKLKYDWVISRNTSSYKQNLVIKINDMPVGEAAPNIRFGETPKKILGEFESIKGSLPKSSHDLLMFRKNIHELNVSQSLKCALDMAIHTDEEKASWGQTGFYTSYSIPILSPTEYGEFISKHGLERFSQLKLKLNKKNIERTLRSVRNSYSGRLFVDFNESFESSDQFLANSDSLNKYDVEIIEQPFHSSSLEANKKIKPYLKGKIFLDENIIDEDIPEDLINYTDGVNIKLQKAGGLTRARDILLQAKKSGLKTMLGCMVETTLGISFSSGVEDLVDYFDLDGHLFIKDEPFGMVFEKNGRISFNKKI